MLEKILVSACLLGECCRYDGGHNYIKKVEEYLRDYEVIKICPEVMGGLPFGKRIPCERINDKVYNKEGNDVTTMFYDGAYQVLKIAQEQGIKKAILKSNSPSCGLGKIYDGNFNGTLIHGDGVCAQLLKEHGIEVLSSDDKVFQ